MNPTRYAGGKGKTGADTEKILKQWFEKFPKESKQSQELMEELANLLNKYNKKVRGNVLIHVLKSGIQA